jgi:threonine dehydratase
VDGRLTHRIQPAPRATRVLQRSYRLTGDTLGGRLLAGARLGREDHGVHETGTGQAPATFEDVLGAARMLQGVAHRTPVITSRTLDALTGGHVALKAESLQRSGAFKFRGAYTKISRLGAGTPHVLTASSGNHAQAVALAARLLGRRATVIVPNDAAAAKVAAAVGYGASVIRYDRYTERREDILASRAAEHGWPVVHPYDDWDVIAGQGTATLELLQDAGPLDVLLVCAGGGGLLAGACLAAGGCSPATHVIGVEPAAGDDLQRSLRAGARVEIDVPRTIADGQQLTTPGARPWEVIRDRAHDVVTVTDDQIRTAMRFATERLKLVLEPSGASALAALLAGRVPTAGRRIGVTLSGGNVDAARFARLISGATSP